MKHSNSIDNFYKHTARLDPIHSKFPIEIVSKGRRDQFEFYKNDPKQMAKVSVRKMNLKLLQVYQVYSCDSNFQLF